MGISLIFAGIATTGFFYVFRGANPVWGIAWFLIWFFVPVVFSVSWSLIVVQPPLAPGERRIRSGPASAIYGPSASIGKLVLTTHRILYLTAVPLLPGHEMPGAGPAAIATDLVTSVEQKSRLAGIASVYAPLAPFSVRLSDGRAYTFQAFPTDRWIAEIERERGAV